MAPKRNLNPVLVLMLYNSYPSYRRVAEELEKMDIINPRTGEPYSHMAVANSYNFAKSYEGPTDKWEEWFDEAGKIIGAEEV